MRLKVFSALCCLFIVNTLLGQEGIQGQVVDHQGRPVEGAEVYIKQTETLRITDENGEFILEEIASGTYDLVVFALEYRVYEQRVEISPAASLRIQ